jgi:hypothetical protein
MAVNRIKQEGRQKTAPLLEALCPLCGDRGRKLSNKEMDMAEAEVILRSAWGQQ